MSSNQKSFSTFAMVLLVLFLGCETGMGNGDYELVLKNETPENIELYIQGSYKILLMPESSVTYRFPAGLYEIKGIHKKNTWGPDGIDLTEDSIFIFRPVTSGNGEEF